MTKYLIRRIFATIPVLFGVLLLVFSMLHFLPGDPVQLMMTESGGGAKAADTSPEQYMLIRHELGLDRPLYVQFGLYVSHAVRGDLGRSFRSQQTVARMIVTVLPNTVRLALVSLGVAVALGLILGTISAVRHNSWLDTLSMFAALIGVAMPGFWLGLMLLFLFSLYLGWLPATGYGSWKAILLPAVTLGFRAAAVIARLTRSSLLEVLNDAFVTTARAKGLRERTVIVEHVLRNALIPIVTVAGLQFGDLLAGTVIIETVFARPGIGSLVVTGVLDKDFPVVQGTVLLIAVCYVLTNLLTDVSYAFIDPRIRYS
jgi:peptide/nickel transport system permease protein